MGTMTYPSLHFACNDFPSSGGNDHCRPDAYIVLKFETQDATTQAPTARGVRWGLTFFDVDGKDAAGEPDGPVGTTTYT